MKIFKTFFGPELCWLLIFVIGAGISKSNLKPNFVFDDLIEYSWVYIPILAFLSMGLYWVPFINKNWLLLRLWVSGLILGHFALITLLNAYSQQGPGIGAGYLAGIILLIAALLIGTILVWFIR